MLEIENASKTFQGRGGSIVTAVDNLSLTVNAGEFVAVQGPSGCGKTTLLLMAGSLLAPDTGEIRIDGENPYLLNPNERARFRARNVGFVFQQFHLVPYLSVLDNVLAPSLATGESGLEDHGRDLIRHFGLEDRITHVPGELSTGERQRTALARALLNRPKLLLADEPTGNLDRENAEGVLKHITEFARDGGAVLLVTHEDQALEHAQRTLQINAGALA